MSCCGGRRAAARAGSISSPSVQTSSAPRAALRHPASLVFTGGGPLVVRGAATGLTYAFPPGGVALPVDGRDVQALMASGAFRRVTLPARSGR